MVMMNWCFQLQCLLLVFYIVVSLEPKASESDHDDDSDDDDFVAVSLPPTPFTWRTRLKVKHVCTTDKIIGVSFYVSTAAYQNKLHSQKVWRCRGNAVHVTLRFRRVRIRMADDIAFRPSLFNKQSTYVEDARIIVWMVDDITWWKTKEEDRQHIYKSAVSKVIVPVDIAPPYSRPYKTLDKSCPLWYWYLVQNPRLSDSAVCQAEQIVVPLLSFPAVFNGQVYGIHRSVSPFTDPVLESSRIKALLSPRFSVEMWVYVIDYCPLAHLSPVKTCTLFSHVSTMEAHLTPAILIDNGGRIQVEGRGPDMYLAHKTVDTIPRRQWVRILFSLQYRKWTLEWSFGRHHNTTRRTEVSYPSDVYFDDTEGFYVIGGADARLGSFLGYFGRVKLYRGRILTLDQLSLPKPTDPMFQIDVRQRQEQCQELMLWVYQRVSFYTHKAAVYRYKHFCTNSYKQFLMGRAANPLLLSCPRRPGIVTKDRKRLAQFLRAAAIRDGEVSNKDNDAIAKRLLDDVSGYVEQHGLADLHVRLPRLQQSSCLGNMDATYTLAVFLNNGVGTAVRENESVSLLMQGALHRHRLSTLALGHRHAMGIDGLPWDRDVAYMYYKDVGDKTKEDRETHSEDQVATEIIRLMDEKTLEQQTDESGDLFMWLKHQAQQGVSSAQSHLAHLYFWGSQGMRRNLQAARHLFQQGAEQGDTDSIYNLGIMELLGRGGSEKNETAGQESLKKAAEKKHPYAISALGWIALEKEKNFTKAAALFEETFKMNFMDSGYYLGHMHHTGLYPNRTRDYDVALRYYEWAAVRGHMIAGLLYAQFHSKGTPKTARNSYIAMEWARYIAEQNSAIGKALRRGVHAYRDGNIPLAAYHYLLSSDAGVEVASFNMAWLCEERKEDVTAAISKECQWRHYNLTVQREEQFIDPYAFIKMGDYFWYGCRGKRNVSLAAQYYAAAGKKMEPHALFNLAFMVEEGAEIPTTIWQSLGLLPKHYNTTVTLLTELYERCRESQKSEAFIPCTLALYRVWLVDLWARYHVYLKTSTYLGCAVAVIGTIYFVIQCVFRIRHHHIQLYQL